MDCSECARGTVARPVCGVRSPVTQATRLLRPLPSTRRVLPSGLHGSSPAHAVQQLCFVSPPLDVPAPPGRPSPTRFLHSGDGSSPAISLLDDAERLPPTRTAEGSQADPPGSSGRSTPGYPSRPASPRLRLPAVLSGYALGGREPNLVPACLLAGLGTFQKSENFTHTFRFSWACLEKLGSPAPLSPVPTIPQGHRYLGGP